MNRGGRGGRGGRGPVARRAAHRRKALAVPRGSTTGGLPTRTSLVLLALALAGPIAASATDAADSHEPRVARERYVAGTGDLACLVSGLGCTRFDVLGGESQVRVTIEDDVHDPVGGNACVDCSVFQSFCATGTLAVEPGTVLFVFVHEARGPLSCGLARGGFATSGWITAEFT